MKHLAKYNVFVEPEGYFDNLSDRIIYKRRTLSRQKWYTQVAAAALVVIGMFIFIYKTSIINENTLQAQIEQEVELYINSGYWDAEDMLDFSENPDELLDAIIAEEWSGYPIDEEEIWY